MSTEDFWPDNLVADLPVTPADILREQAGLLGPKTNNLVLADVDVRPRDDGGFQLDFYLRIPSLDDYRYDLFTLNHGVDLYPVKTKDRKSLSDAEELKAFIAERLNDTKTVSIIRSLVSQAKNASRGGRQGFGGGGKGYF